MADLASDPNQSLHDILGLGAAKLGALHDRYYPEVYQFAYYRLHDAQLAEEVTHTVFLELLNEAKQTSGSQRNLRGWLMSCVSKRVNEQLIPNRPALVDDGVTSFQAPQEEMVIDQEAQELSRQKFLAAAKRGPYRKTISPAIGRPHFRLVLGILAIILLIGATITLVASDSALPGDRLYPFKHAWEELQLFLAGGLSQRLEIEKSYDQNRFDEVQSLLQAHREATLSLVGGLSQMNPDEWLVGDLLVVISPNTRLIGQIEPGWYLLVEGELQPDGTILAHQVQPREYTVSGKLQRIQEQQWLVDGVTIQVPPEAIVMGTPKIGKQIQGKAYRSLDDNLVARWVKVEP